MISKYIFLLNFLFFSWSFSSLAHYHRHYDYKFVRLSSNQSIYLLNRGCSQALSLDTRKLESATLKSFGFDNNTLESISYEELAKYCSLESKVPLVRQTDTSPDEVMRVYVLKVLFSH